MGGNSALIDSEEKEREIALHMLSNLVTYNSTFQRNIKNSRCLYSQCLCPALPYMPICYTRDLFRIETCLLGRYKPDLTLT